MRDVTFLHSDASVELSAMMANAETEIMRVTGIPEHLLEGTNMAAPREAEHYPRLPRVNADMSVTQRNAYYDEGGWFVGDPDGFTVYGKLNPPRRTTPLALTPEQHTRLMDAIATRTTWIKHPVAPQTPTPEIAWSANDCRASMFQPVPHAS